MVDVHFVDGDKLLQQMQAWFAEHLPKARTILASKASVYTEDDPKLFSESMMQRKNFRTDASPCNRIDFSRFER